MAIQVSAGVALVVEGACLVFEGVLNKCVGNWKPVPSIQEKIYGNNQIVKVIMIKVFQNRIPEE
jgi:hypothetical protein